MKNLTYLLLLSCSISFSQTIEDDILLTSPYSEYIKDRGINSKTKDSLLFTNKMMTVLFEKNVGTSFGGSNDLSTKKYFTTLNATDNSLAIGANFSNREDKLEKLKWIITTGVKFKASDGLSVVIENGDIQENNISLTASFTTIGRGIINYNKEIVTEKIKQHRIIERKLMEFKTKVFNENELKKAKELSRIKFQRQDDLITDKEEKVLRDIIEKKYKDLNRELIDNELAVLKANRDNYILRNWWLNGSIVLPIGVNKYNTTNTLNFPLRAQEFYAFEILSSLNYIILKNDNTSWFLKARGTIKNNNNILVNNLTSTTFSTFSTGFNNNQVATGSRNGYITNYSEFLTASLYLEPTYFFHKNIIGISPAIELNMGKYNAINWKIGIPISLKDKNGKPVLNFELQWREDKTFNGSRHIVGISTSFLFGKLNDI